MCPLSLYQDPEASRAMLRELGVRLLSYIKNILVMANSPGKVRDHTLSLSFLLEKLGFIVHPGKGITTPTQEIEFLGMVIHTPFLELCLPGKKFKKLRVKANKLGSLKQPPFAQDVSRELEKMNAVSQAVPPAPLFYRSPSERTWHINCLEILAVTLEVKTFLKHQTNKHVLLHLDNMTAVAYINNMGGTVSPQATTLVRDVWI